MKGWIAVDLDGTLAEYHGWVDELHIGPPVPRMIRLVKGWVSKGIEVRVFTARVSETKDDSNKVRNVKLVEKVIQDWCEQHIGVRLKVTNQKDYGMIELWDDRAIRVVKNNGCPCCDHHYYWQMYERKEIP